MTDITKRLDAIKTLKEDIIGRLDRLEECCEGAKRRSTSDATKTDMNAALSDVGVIRTKLNYISGHAGGVLNELAAPETESGPNKSVGVFVSTELLMLIQMVISEEVVTDRIQKHIVDRLDMLLDDKR